jgi:HicB family
MQEAIAAVERAADEFIAAREEDGDDVPAPLTERKYSGKFVVRTSPALHARLAVEAAEQNVSMNQWGGALALWELCSAANRTVRPVISHTASFAEEVCPQGFGTPVAGVLRTPIRAPRDRVSRLPGRDRRLPRSRRG